MDQRYRVFKRAAKNFEQFARARKFTVRRGLTYSEAQTFCASANKQLTPANQRAGMKYEFEQE
jgi:hypothetical protein